MAKSPEEATATMIANLAEKTDKSLAEWLKIVQNSNFSKHGEIVKFLKTEHNITHGYANLIAHSALQSAADTAPEGTDFVELQYSGSKAKLRPIYDALIEMVKRFGADIEIAPKKAYVSLRRSKQFAIIQPSTATRVDVGIQLKGEKPNERLEPSSSFNAMVSHRVRVGSVEEVDKQLEQWLKMAYDIA